MNNTNHMISSDHKGAASVMFEKMINVGQPVGQVHTRTDGRTLRLSRQNLDSLAISLLENGCHMKLYHGSAEGIIIRHMRACHFS